MDSKRKNLFNVVLLLLDIICILISFLVTTWIRYGALTKDCLGNIFEWNFITMVLIYIVIYISQNASYGLQNRSISEELLTVVKLNSILGISLIVVMFFFQNGSVYSRGFFICFLLLNTLITFTIRLCYKTILLTSYKRSDSSNKTMIITTSDQARTVLEHVRSENQWIYDITYLTVLDKNMVGEKIEDIDVKADFLTMFEVAKQEVIDSVFIHIPNDYPVSLDLDEIIQGFEEMGITVNLSINTFGLKLHEKTVQHMCGYHVLTFSTKMFNDSQLVIKRLMDILGGVVGCILTLFICILIAPCILIESPGPVFFSQIRVGKNGRRFHIYKFRSMYCDAEERKLELMAQNEMNGLMFKMADDPRITKVGKFIRRTSLDEFPQFINVLKGDMSLVGTRPPTEDEFLQYERWHKRRLTLKSGLTGLWQVSGRSDIRDFEEVVKMDLNYIDNWSLQMDIMIILKTIKVVLFGKGSR